MFTSSVIRKLARSEEIFAETDSFVGLGAHLRGPVDVDALSDAFDALLEAHPVLGGHLERSPDGAARDRRRRPAPPGNRGGANRRSGREAPPCSRPERVADPSAVDPVRDERRSRRCTSTTASPTATTSSASSRNCSPTTPTWSATGACARSRFGRRRNRWKSCSPNGRSRSNSVRGLSGSCRPCSPTTCRRPGGRRLRRQTRLCRCVFRWRAAH